MQFGITLKKNCHFGSPKPFLLERHEPGATSCPDAKSQDCPVFHIGSAAGLLNILAVRKIYPPDSQMLFSPHWLCTEHHYLCRASVSMAITDGKCCGIIHVQQRRQSRRRGRWGVGEGARPGSTTLGGVRKGTWEWGE